MLPCPGRVYWGVSPVFAILWHREVVPLNLNFADKEEYKDIPLFRMEDNRDKSLLFFIRKYSTADITNMLHRHDYMQFNYIFHGKGKHFVRNNEFDIIKGDIFAIPPYVPHFIKAYQDSGIEIFEVEFEPEFINQNFENIENIESFFDFAYIEPFLVGESQVKPRLNLTGKLQVEVEDILNVMLKEYSAKKPGYMLLIKSLLLKLLVLVGREFTRELENSDSLSIYQRHRDAIFNAIKYIDENYSSDLNVENVSKKFMLSQSYFRYLFKSINSMTFTEYLSSLRISRAMELLKTTDLRVLDICHEVGFNNVNHFNRLFGQKTGASPLMYRKKYR